MELKQIGRYDIKLLIGQGGMSAVYLGYDPRALRQVAIKILPPYYLHAPKFRERFEREALMVAVLEHPAIVPVYDMGEEDGQPYIVMRYMSGGSLTDKLKKGPIPIKECSEMFLRLAPALDTAHTRGITHRDVKPDNLLFDKYDNVYLSDFGLARLRETIGFANISDGSILGTPAFMSPEQIQGDREIDGRSDIYSMGVVLFQMLCGKVPFDGPTAASIMMMHLINPVPQICELNRNLPPAIQKVLETAMAKNPADRYKTAGEFARAFQVVAAAASKRQAANPAAAVSAKKPEPRSTRIFTSKKSSTANREAQVSPAIPGQLNGQNFPFPGAGSNDQGIAPSPLAALPQREMAQSSATTNTDFFPQPKRLPIPSWAWFPIIAIIIIFSFLLIQWLRGEFPFSYLPGVGSTPEKASASFTLGHADMLAFLNRDDIWASNLDGSGLIQLTIDGAKKSNLNWSPDGESVMYTTNECVKTVSLKTRLVLTLGCFSGISSIPAFDISSDGKNVALGLPGSDLYLLPYDQLLHLGQANSPGDLTSLAQCPNYAPFHVGDTIKSLKWSATGGQLAIITSRQTDNTSRDLVNIYDFSRCASSPVLIKEFLPTFFLFTMRGYYEHPQFSRLSWNGNDQLLLNGTLNDGGFGDLQLVYLDQNKTQEIAPNGPCCYREASFSPDGSYIFYTFQPESGGDISLYYSPFGDLNQPGEANLPLVFPSGFFASSTEPLQAVLRTAR